MLLLSLLSIPLLGAAILGGWQGLGHSCARRIAVIWALLPVLLAVIIGSQQVDPVSGLLASCESRWLPDAGISLRFAVDGTSWLFLLLTSLVSLFALVASARLEIGGRAYCALILVLEGMLFGVFTARHFIPWFLCWEMTLIPSYLLIRLWGGPGAPRAALRFFIMTLGGSVFMLLGFLALQLAAGTMDFNSLATLAANHELMPKLAATFVGTGYSGQFLLGVVAVCVFLGLAVKLPVFPFHAWLPAAYAEAPTPVTMLLTGLLSKMGVYGLLRILLPIFPEVLPGLAPSLMVLAVLTVLLGAVAALAVIGLLLTAVFFLRMVRLVFHGPLNPACAQWPDLSSGERWILAPAIALIIIPGLWPQVLLHCLNADTVRLLDLLRILP